MLPKDRLLRFMFRNAFIGGAVALVTVALILVLDIAGLRGLIQRSEDGVLALSVLTVLFVITFGGVQIGVAVMLIPWEERSRTGERTDRTGH